MARVGTDPQVRPLLTAPYEVQAPGVWTDEHGTKLGSAVLVRFKSPARFDGVQVPVTKRPNAVESVAREMSATGVEELVLMFDTAGTLVNVMPHGRVTTPPPEWLAVPRSDH